MTNGIYKTCRQVIAKIITTRNKMGDGSFYTTRICEATVNQSQKGENSI